MPASIPYDPSLTLMSVVNDKALTAVEEISKAQDPVYAAKDSLDSLIASKRSLEMTKTELKNLGVGTDALDTELTKLSNAILQSAADHEKAKVLAEPKIQQLRAAMRNSQVQFESPVDGLRSGIKTLPLASNTMNMNVQYFSVGSDQQTSAVYVSQIASYVSGTMSRIFGPSEYTSIGTAAANQVAQELKRQNLEGTLVISVCCTHQNVSMVAPFVLNLDKAVKIWNELFPGNKLDPTSRSDMMKVAMGERNADKYSIISGTTFGSGFVGMVHAVKTSDASAAEDLTGAATSLQATIDAGSWYNGTDRRKGLDSSFDENIRRLFSEQNVQSNATVLTMGVGSGDATTPAPSGGLDVGAMLQALDDYLKKMAASTGGTPLHHYLKDIDKKSLAEQLIAKYYPGKCEE
ncbi:hypothetical protein CERZMDRAFT_46327 [Cercospora zeae-maydis SCOH1-5]|uniref:Uncharacterized protein n=1 Tax=Cercospora zeae-maydis SCOH1-5 TaxID=717836 RepID=A0A6A6F917_9PEZI|nr:hypothetical protein CERZMDRAFT_46327 [Cercospora zeae-maydis SCOH1-5]